MRSSVSLNWTVRKPVVHSAGGIVAAQSTRAAAVGAQVLADGGNAVDAAAATSFALAAAEPWMSGLGGGGYMLIWIAAERRFYAIDFGMIAPLALDPADYPLGGTPAGDIVFGWPGVVEDRNLLGPLSMAVPGHVDGIGLALERFGTRPLSEVLAGAIDLAEQGMGIDWFASLHIGVAASGLSRFAVSRETWLPGGVPPGPDWEGQGKRLPLGNLGATLRTVASEGRRSFYDGDLAAGIAADIEALGGKITQTDLSRYRARLVEPMTTRCGDSTIATVGGMTAGPALIRCFEEMASLRPGSAPDAATYVAYADVFQRVNRDRLEKDGDSDETRSPSCTSHFSVIDRAGNMVSVTQTLVSIFGSKVLLPRSGIMMNNSIMTFDPRPGRPNSLGPGKRPLANMCPILATTDGRPHFALGASGGRRIMPAVVQIADFIARFGLSLEDAFHQPRIDSSGTDLVSVDPRLPAPIRCALASRFQTTEKAQAIYPMTYACPSAVWQGPDDTREGTSEPMHPCADALAETDRESSRGN